MRESLHKYIRLPAADICPPVCGGQRVDDDEATKGEELAGTQSLSPPPPPQCVRRRMPEYGFSHTTNFCWNVPNVALAVLFSKLGHYPMLHIVEKIYDFIKTFHL